MQKPLARWTIGPVTQNGQRCLEMSIKSFTSIYDVDVVICHNGLKPDLPYKLLDQQPYSESKIKPSGVSWKLYPPRLDLARHEIIIDNDIIFVEEIPEITKFFNSNQTLLLEGISRNYGRFDKHIPPGYNINSGIYGMPPEFDLNRYLTFYCNQQWEENARGSHSFSKTFDEQGIVALSLLDYNHIIIPSTSVTDCSKSYIPSKGMHFIGLNRNNYHFPFRLYCNQFTKLF